MKNKFELEHIGINTANAEEAANLAQLLSTMFNLEPRHGQKSEFGGAYFECMKAPFLGPTSARTHLKILITPSPLVKSPQKGYHKEKT